MLQSKGTTAAASACISHLLNEAISKFFQSSTSQDVTTELLDAYQVVHDSNEYTDKALSDLFFQIKEIIALVTELERVRQFAPGTRSDKNNS